MSTASKNKKENNPDALISEIDTILNQTLSKAILDSIMEGVIILDKELDIHYMNNAAETITRSIAHSYNDKKIDELMKLVNQDGDIVSWPLEDVAEQGSTHNQVSDYSVELHDGKVFSISYSAAPMHLADGTIAGMTVIFRDISQEKELMRLKSEFVSIVSHQLRTPASTVKWYIEALLDNRHGKELNAWQISKLQQSYQSNERMIDLINDLLNVSRLESGRIDVHPEELNLRVLFDEAIKEMVHFAKAHNIELHNTISKDIPLVYADKGKIREVIINFLSNAIKYTKSGHHTITIGAEQNADAIEYWVKDEGIGIPSKDIAHIFEKFFRSDNAIESQTEGSGLGLYIARQIILLHNGDVRIESVKDEGTTIYFSLPFNNKKA
ncbi:MAG: ATP-binding protein [bacterium]|nr:ATP-binding protein [bacterium]